MVYWDESFGSFAKVTDNTGTMSKFDHYIKHEKWYVALMIVSYFLINNSILATSVVMEANRSGQPGYHAIWEPFVWEYSSAIGNIICIPLVLILMRRIPLDWSNIKSSLAIYLVASIPFSLLHVGIMVGLRKFVYWTQERFYDFGDIPFELVYEYRKDVWGFVFLIMVIKSYQFIVSRLRGEANLIAHGEDETPNTQRDRLLVKKLGKEFIVKVSDIEWLESAGNYVNLHIRGRIYPTRATLTNLVEQISEKGFCRIHRSYAVNLDQIDSITPLNSGDSEVRLSNGKILNLSRRYKDGLKSRLH